MITPPRYYLSLIFLLLSLPAAEETAAEIAPEALEEKPKPKRTRKKKAEAEPEAAEPVTPPAANDADGGETDTIEEATAGTPRRGWWQRTFGE